MSSLVENSEERKVFEEKGWKESSDGVWKFCPAILSDTFGSDSLDIRKNKMALFIKNKMYLDNKLYTLF